MSHSIREFCERLAGIEKGKITIVWTSVLREPGDDIPVLTVAGELLDDKLSFSGGVPCYGDYRAFRNMAEGEIVTSFRLVQTLAPGIKIFVESLL